MPDIGITGGSALERRLSEIAARIGQPASVRVGFLEGATYPDGTSIAYIAAINEFGATVNRSPGTVTVFRKLRADGDGFARNGRFVKRRESNFATDHATSAYTITIPPRPFFRTMVKQNGAGWPDQIAQILRSTDYDVTLTLGRMGKVIEGQLVQSIQALTSPPNAPSTVQRKGFSKPLIDTGVMWQSVDSEVTAGAAADSQA